MIHVPLWFMLLGMFGWFGIGFSIGLKRGREEQKWPS